VKNTWLINQLKIVKKFNSVIGHLGTLKQKIANEFASRLLLRKIFGKFNSYWQKAAEIKITYVIVKGKDGRLYTIPKGNGGPYFIG